MAAGSAQAVDLTIVSWGGGLHGEPAEGLSRPLHGGQSRRQHHQRRQRRRGPGQGARAGGVEQRHLGYRRHGGGRRDHRVRRRPHHGDRSRHVAGTGARRHACVGGLLRRHALAGRTNCFIPQIVYSTTFGYRTDVFEGDQPATIADVFDLEKYPGKRSLERRPINNLEWALLADGVAPADVYPMLSTSEGVARALAKLDTIKDQTGGLVDQGRAAAAAAGGRRGRHRLGL